jgi:cobalt-zinc-cadmium efflux system protein
MTVVLGLTASYLVVEVVGGILTGSLALLADAAHMLTDVAALGLALMAISFGQRAATPERSFGYHRVEILAAMANAVVLLGISALILYEAYDRFVHPPEVASRPMLIVATIGLMVNVVSMALLQAGSKESLNVKGAYLEVLSDALTSVGVIVAAALIWATGWTRVDAIISAGIGLFIVPRTWALLTEGTHVLLEGTPADVNLAAVRAALAGVAGVADVHDLHAWSLTSGVNALSVHVVLAEGASHRDVLSAVHQRLTSEFPIRHATVQIEPYRWHGDEGETHPCG